MPTYRDRKCYNCFYYTHAGGKPPECRQGINPALKDAPHMSDRIQGLFEPDDMAAFCDHYMWLPEKFPRLRHRAHNEIGRALPYSTAELDETFAPYYEKGEKVRIKVDIGYGITRCGYVGLSTGEQPVFLLMRRQTDRGSGVILDSSVRLIAVKYNEKGRYLPL